ncbi:MAG: lipopolysaccharide core heptose(I) kinase RfaP [Proteobacteria bacterium]|nr:lipopolysaccharide core heptose(I) kinase RfaP [Pseudomonadota bacterium]
MIYVRDELKGAFSESSVAEFMRIDGETVKHVVEDRRTFHFQRQGGHYYMKAHFGVGWKEIFKNLLTLKVPVVGARNEWEAIRAFERLGVATMRIAAYGEVGWNPAKRHSFLITDALEQTEDLEQWLPTLDLTRPEDVRLKRAIISKIGSVARTLHLSGLNHRDFYLCHFRIDLSEGKPAPESVRLHVMDLHRVQQRRKTPERWAVKDVAGLVYSALNVVGKPLFSRTDVARFICSYEASDLKQACQKNPAFWRSVFGKVMGFARRKQYNRAALPAWLGRPSR